MVAYSQAIPSDHEAGGLLLGRLIIDCNDVVIDDVTVPDIEDQSGRFFFFRKALAHQEKLKQRWLQSNGTCNYLGEWHTHPEAIPRPSSHDISNWKRILWEAKYDSGFLFFIIVGTQTISVWEGKKDNLDILELHCRNTEEGGKMYV